MTTLREKRDQAVEIARTMKEQQVAAVRRRNPRKLWQTDLHPLVEGWRGDERVVAVICDEIDRDDMLTAARSLALGFGCDTLCVITEGWHPPTEHAMANPRTGRPWGPGQMQELAEDHDALGRGWLVESLNVVAVNRAGDLSMMVQDYLITQREHPARLELTWGESLDNEEHDAKAGGYVTSTLARYMNEPPMDIVAARAGVDPADFGVTDPEEVRAHLDCATVRVLAANGISSGILLRYEEGSVRQRIIEESLGESR